MAVFDIKRLRALQDEVPKTRIAVVRLVWSEVKAALNRGHSLKSVHQRLTEAGIGITYRPYPKALAVYATKRNTLAYRPKLQGNLVLSRTPPARPPEWATTNSRGSKPHENEAPHSPQQPIHSPTFENEPQELKDSSLNLVRQRKQADLTNRGTRE